MAFWNSKYRNGSEKALRTAAQLVAGSAVGRSAGFNIGSSSSSFSNGSSDIDDATRLLLRARADAFYRGQTGELKAVIDNSFAAADETRRGRVTLPEVLKGVAPLCIEAGDQDVIVKLFRFLSASPNPNSEPLLSFPDFLVISYVFACGIRLCNSCSLPVLPMLGYSCRACLELASGTFDLCLPCYSSRRFPAHLHDPSSFVDHGILYNALTLNKLVTFLS
ncbi:hypothetical protein L7F22_052252 [Adiantum nelumboides]|nr:hypothetical protein [Adiantum nelumboides]